LQTTSAEVRPTQARVDKLNEDYPAVSVKNPQKIQIDDITPEQRQAGLDVVAQRQRLWKVLDYKPSAWSLFHVHGSTSRFTAMCTTRQCGKTTSGAAEIQSAMMEPKHPIFGVPWVGVLSYDLEHAELMVDRWILWVTDAFGQDYLEVNRNKRQAIIKATGAKLTWNSSMNPRSLGGPTYSALFVDEAQKVSDEAWNVIRPALNVREAPVFAFGTPDMIADQTWFRGMWLRGQGGEPNYHSHTVTCFENPWIALDEIRDARKDMSDEEFRMLLLGQWLDIDGRVFRDFESCFFPDVYENYNEHEVAQGKRGPFIMGVDLAKENDYTVAYIFDQRRQQTVHKYRVNSLDYPVVERELAALYTLWHCEYMVMDTTRESGVADHCRELGCSVRPFIFGSANKAELIANLNRKLQHGILRLSATDTQLFKELEVYRRKVTPGGNIQYSSPVNFFDDSLIALGLCVHYSRRDFTNITRDTSRYVTVTDEAADGSYEQSQELLELAEQIDKEWANAALAA
jgi:hypothetical protein